jgi:regulator of sigma E protease
LRPWQPEVEPRIGQLSEDGPAMRAGLRSDDLVLAINGVAVPNWMDLVGIVQASPNQLLQFEVLRADARLVLDVTPSLRPEPGSDQGYIGAGVVVPEWPDSMLRDLSQGPIDALVSGFSKTSQMIGLTLDSIKKMILGAISVKNLSGPITIAKVAGASAASGLESFISFLAYLSISLGVLNLLPIPMLDGGHLVYYFVELVRGRPVSEKVQMFGMRIGMALLFSLMALAMINDIARL